MNFLKNACYNTAGRKTRSFLFRTGQTHALGFGKYEIPARQAREGGEHTEPPEPLRGSLVPMAPDGAKGLQRTSGLTRLPLGPKAVTGGAWCPQGGAWLGALQHPAQALPCISSHPHRGMAGYCALEQDVSHHNDDYL